MFAPDADRVVVCPAQIAILPEIVRVGKAFTVRLSVAVFEERHPSALWLDNWRLNYSYCIDHYWLAVPKLHCLS